MPTTEVKAADADGLLQLGWHHDAFTISHGFADPELPSFVRAHYADPPFVGIPRWLIRRVLAACAKTSSFTLLVARAHGDFAGLMLAQTLGDRPWRMIFRDSPLLLVAGAILVTGKRFRSLFRVKARGMASQTPETARRAESHGQADAIRVRVEFIYIHPRFRGMRLAGAILQRLERDMVPCGVGVGVAHIASHNVSSRAAFTSAGWSVSPSASGSLEAFKRFGQRQSEAPGEGELHE